jgi:hypothetical protein
MMATGLSGDAWKAHLLGGQCMRTISRILPVLLLLGLAPAGCFQPQQTPGSGSVGLNIGQVAPEIEGEDLEGKHFKLSDYRGKVVVLDFWGNW